MNKVMMEYIEQIRQKPDTYIRNRTACERFLNSYPREMIAEVGRKNSRPVMFKDKWFSYGKNFLLGMDFDFLMLEACVLSSMN